MSKLFKYEIEEFIHRNVVGIGNYELAELINKTFSTNYTQRQVKSYKKRNKLSSGLTGRFEKGNVPQNKGKKGACAKGSEKYWFKKGQRPINYRPVGSERVDAKKGYTLVKTEDPNKWELKQHVIWKSSYGNIPTGYKVIFLDMDNTNFDINNLAIVTNEELLTMNRNKLRYNNPFLTDTGIMIAKVINSKNRGIKRKNKRAHTN